MESTHQTDLQHRFILRFVHFTKLVSSSDNVDFSPLYGSLRISEEGLYSLSYSLQASANSKYDPSRDGSGEDGWC